MTRKGLSKPIYMWCMNFRYNYSATKVLWILIRLKSVQRKPGRQHLCNNQPSVWFDQVLGGS